MEGQTWPIKSEIKSKRIKWIYPPTHIAWAYLKELRENNKTKKIYDVDPYVEVYQFRDNLYGLFAENADGMADYWMYLIIGPESALLIDTGYGIGDTKGLVETITGGMATIVANTHGHFDHAYGNCRFDKVYCNEHELGRLQAQDEHMWDYLFDGDGNCIWMEFDKNDLPTFKKYEIVPCKNGYTFNLGEGYEVEMVWLPGHAPGHCGFLDKKNRILFAGDSMSSVRSGHGTVDRPNPRASWGGAKYSNLASFTKELDKLVKRMDEFDYVFPSHNMVNIEKGIVPCILKACEEVLEDPNNYDSVFTYVNSKDETSKLFVKEIEGYSQFGYTI